MQAACWSVVDNSSPPAPLQLLQAEALLMCRPQGPACLVCKLPSDFECSWSGRVLVELSSRARYTAARRKGGGLACAEELLPNPVYWAAGGLLLA